MRHYGIILHRFFPKKNKIAVLDSVLGRIDGIVRHDGTMLGALMSYEIEHKSSAYFLQNLQIEDLPLALARMDILFVHHLLELCYYFMPVGSCVVGIFELLQVLYMPQVKDFSTQSKKIILFKLLATLGVHASVHVQDTDLFDQLMHMSIDTIGCAALDLKNEKKLDMWLLYCMVEYADIDALKTIQFLVKSRVA